MNIFQDWALKQNLWIYSRGGSDKCNTFLMNSEKRAYIIRNIDRVKYARCGAVGSS